LAVGLAALLLQSMAIMNILEVETTMRNAVLIVMILMVKWLRVKVRHLLML
jgi:hypothetical protein